MKRQPHQNGRGTSDVWLTPQWILDPLGPFGLDPCTPEFQPWPTAARRYTEADDGLVQPWFGRVFMNPPYSRPAYSRFMAKMAAHGHGTSLIFARTETRDFFAHVWRRATALLFLEGRIFFHHPDGRLAEGNAGAPSVLCAYGQFDAEVLGDCGLQGKFVPLLIPRAFVVAAVQESWRDVVVRLARSAGGAVRVDDLYRAVSGHAKTRANPNWRAKLRQALQRGPFERIGQGEWRLAT